MGHRLGTKGFIVFDINSREIFISKNVVFHENIFPFHNASIDSTYAYVLHSDLSHNPDLDYLFRFPTSPSSPPPTHPIELPTTSNTDLQQVVLLST